MFKDNAPKPAFQPPPKEIKETSNLSGSLKSISNIFGTAEVLES
jgi:hypothetical protein